MTLEKERIRDTSELSAASTPEAPGGPPVEERPMPDALPVEPPAADDEAALRADILMTRRALGDTVEELANRVNPVVRGREVAAEVRGRMSHLTGSARRYRVPLLAVTAGLVMGVAGLVFWRVRRNATPEACRRH
jgi:hypothetical protein